MLYVRKVMQVSSTVYICYSLSCFQTRKNDFKEADAQLGMQQRNFWKYSLDYVTAIQELHERMKFECVETLSSFLYSWLTFYHVGQHFYFQ